MLLGTSHWTNPSFGQTTGGADKGLLTYILSQNARQRPTDETVKRVQAIVDKNPQDYFARLVMGNTLDSLGLPEQAIEQYQLAVKLAPENPRPIIELVKAELSTGKREAAMRLLQEASKRFPNDSEILFWMGNYYLTKGDFKNANVYLNKASSKGNASIFGMSSSKAEIELKQGHFGYAVLLAEEDLARDPNYPLGNAVKGLGLFGLHRYKYAAPFLQKAFEKFPLHAEYSRKYGECCLVTGDYEHALEPAMVAMAIESRRGFPLDESKWLMRSTLAQLPYSFVMQETPVFLDKINKVFSNSRVHFVYGDIFDSFGYHALATREYFDAYKLDKTNAQALLKLANNLETYYQKYDQAVYFLTQAHTLEPANTEIADRLDRLMSRLSLHKSDLAWQIKDWLWSQRSPIE